MAGKRRFGRVRQLPSGRYQARYLGPDGVDRPAPNTFASKTDADQWLVLKEAEIRRGEWIDPDAGRVPFEVFAKQWIDDRVLKPRTEGLYRGLLRNHLLPTFGNFDLVDIREADVRRWRKERLGVVGQSTVAKAYQLLKSILNTAVDDELIRRNPCRIKGAGVPDTPERQMIPLGKVIEILAKTPERYRALVLLGTFASLRWGELAALRRRHLDLEAGLVRVEGAIAELDGGKLVEDTPKSRAGRRVVSIPAEIIPDLRAHLDKFAEEGPDGRVFVGPKGGPLRRSGFRRIWNKVRKDVDLPDLHFHDLRHVGNTLAATTGASLKELMARMGHASTRAALIYQHATQDRDRAIAEALGEAFKIARDGGKPRKGTKKRSGTQRARKPKRS
ncbi:putative prophage phiRv2 integrase [Actinomadura sp. NBRC 104412]|uniref:tyrosine-type recombinase/integrase n=1 Tax=Actinomadura sp. NBRC 104412 TaxID=3032203 RepID=UPI0024A5F609|nr:site-specific integrase [Actinomadura sp. NBRC 104412]GLZ07668.1 putative prophage phiRv2 integrase [Actinomadura sp. NBRC 104412]